MDGKSFCATSDKSRGRSSGAFLPFRVHEIGLGKCCELPTQPKASPLDSQLDLLDELFKGRLSPSAAALIVPSQRIEASNGFLQLLISKETQSAELIHRVDFQLVESLKREKLLAFKFKSSEVASREQSAEMENSQQSTAEGKSPQKSAELHCFLLKMLNKPQISQQRARLCAVSVCALLLLILLQLSRKENARKSNN